MHNREKTGFSTAGEGKSIEPLSDRPECECLSVTQNLCLIKSNLKIMTGSSLVVQWLGLCALTAEGPGSVSGWGTKIPQAMW